MSSFKSSGDRNPFRSTMYCSFCGKSQHEVKKMVAGPNVFACDECIDLMHDIVHDKLPPDPPQPPPHKPLKERLEEFKKRQNNDNR